MGLLDKVKGFFTKETMPDETRLLLAGVENVHELRRGLDEIVTRNEVELKEVEREIDKLEKIELAEKDKVKAGTLSPRKGSAACSCAVTALQLPHCASTAPWHARVGAAQGPRMSRADREPKAHRT